MHVVHVEDEKALLKVLATAFRITYPDMNLKQFISGDEALEYLETDGKTADLFILDIRLPGSKNGLEVAQRIRELGCPGHIVLTSAYSAPSLELLNALKAEYYPKPWHLLELQKKLPQYLLKAGVAQEFPVVEAASSLPPEPSANCPQCGRPRTLGISICIVCGRRFEEIRDTNTVSSVVSGLPPTTIPVLQGNLLLEETQRVTLEKTGIVISLPIHEQVVLGRAGSNLTKDSVLIDLTPFASKDTGISRYHAKFTRKGRMLYLMDLGSTNGTWLNGERLSAYKDQVVHNNDLIRLALLELRVKFKR